MVDVDTRMRELEHRFRNILTIARSLVSQSLRSAKSLDEARATIDQRLEALGGATEQLLRHDWKAAPLREVAQNALAHFTLYKDKVRFDGPLVAVGPHAAMTLTLAFHELMTNAIKYGALSSMAGAIDLTWKEIGSDDRAEVWLRWLEHGGPPVVKPEREGFGTRLTCTATGRSLQGAAQLDFEPSGVVWTLRAPLAAIHL
ncbi:sensor histidine kinase [Sphingobium sp. DC-2]|uniref:sensor histidine kinase n=1 Tax=Sphingobium sp. DC-2 TaxID=1303256 RepID=UPI00068C65CB|nr:sensor histidine kinase [Sphingobium sp. DC-2]